MYPVRQLRWIVLRGLVGTCAYPTRSACSGSVLSAVCLASTPSAFKGEREILLAGSYGKYLVSARGMSGDLSHRLWALGCIQ